MFSKSDPMCVVKMKTAEFSQWREIFRTEKISNTLNPDFTKKVSSKNFCLLNSMWANHDIVR